MCLHQAEASDVVMWKASVDRTSASRLKMRDVTGHMLVWILSGKDSWLWGSPQGSVSPGSFSWVLRKRPPWLRTLFSALLRHQVSSSEIIYQYWFALCQLNSGKIACSETSLLSKFLKSFVLAQTDHNYYIRYSNMWHWQSNTTQNLASPNILPSFLAHCV